MKKIILVIVIVLGTTLTCYSQRLKQKVGNNPTLIASSAVLEVESTNKGVLIPRVALTGTTDLTTIASPTISLLVYNTASTGTPPNNVYPGFYYWDGTIWTRLFNTPYLASIDCSSATHNGLLSIGNAANGVSSSIPYTGGNGGYFAQQSIASTGVTGLTATIVAGTLASGLGTLIYSITGTPSSIGTASFAINIGGKSCTLNRTVHPQALLSSVNCNGATHNGNLTIGFLANESTVIPYTVGNGGVYLQQSIASTGVTGLTATRSIGLLASGAGAVTYTITGTPSAVGTASFSISIGGQSCTFTRQVGCGAYVASGVFKVFACHNLGADTTKDPNIPTIDINGNYYQWGRISPVANVNTPSGSIVGWNTSSAVNGSWSFSKTGNDPCPAGFRVPTISEWLGVIVNNTVSRTGTPWVENSNLLGSAIHFGPTNTSIKWLTLPAAGQRYQAAGDLAGRNQSGFYWSSSETGANSNYLYFNEPYVVANFDTSRLSGYSVRCISQ